MNTLFHKSFKKKYGKLTKNLQNQTDERLVLFRRDPFNELLNNHALTGKHLGYRSINVTGDYRAVYKPLDQEIGFFVNVDTHSNLYK